VLRAGVLVSVAVVMPGVLVLLGRLIDDRGLGGLGFTTIRALVVARTLDRCLVDEGHI
jgi:hypothetical protein